MAGRWDVITVFLYHLVLHVVQPVLQYVLDLAFGPRTKHPDNESFPCYDVLINFKLHMTWCNGINWFLLKFRKMADIAVIEHEDVHLYSVSLHEFHFVRVKRGINLSDVEKHPIMWFSKHDYATEVIIVPHEPVYKYIMKRPDRDGRNITIIHNTGRCGSTLLASMIHRTKQCQVISEPFPLLRFSQLTNMASDIRPLDCAENLKLLKAMMIILCNDPTKLYCIKPTGVYSGNLVHLFHKILPEIKEIFMYRALKPTISSWKRILGPVYLSLATARGAKAYQSIKYRRIFEKIDAAKRHALEKRIFTLLCTMHPFFLECADRKDLTSYSYESLLTDRERFCRSLLSKIGIDEKHVASALTAMERDSHDNTALSRSPIGGNAGFIPEETLQWARKVAKEEFGIELEGEDCVILNVPNSWTLRSE